MRDDGPLLTRRLVIGGAAAGIATAPILARGAAPASPGTGAAGDKGTIFADDFGPIAGWRRHGPILKQDLPWETSLMQDPCLVYGERPGPLFKMWYGSISHIGYATSEDGQRWTKRPQPVLSPTLPTESKALNQPSVVFHDGIWHMTYFGVNDAGDGQIHYASAARPEGPWQKKGVVLTFTMPWEDRYIYNSSLMFDADERIWKLWYTAGKIASAGGEPRYICYATAERPDGPWIKHPRNPVLRPMDDGGWASFGIGGPNVRKLDDGTYEIRLAGWQFDYPSRGGRLVSPDGIGWALDRAAMDLDLGVVGGPEDAMIYRQFIVRHQGRDHCYYNVKNYRPGWNETIELATWETGLEIVDPSKWAMLQGGKTPNGASFVVRDGAARSLGNAGAQPQTLQGNRRIDGLDYGLSATVTPGTAAADRGSVLILRATDTRNYYYGGLGRGGHEYVIGIVEDGRDRILAGTGAADDIAAGPYRLTFIAQGSSLILSNGSRTVLSAIDPTLIPEHSYVGFEVGNGSGQVSFSSVKVFAL